MNNIFFIILLVYISAVTNISNFEGSCSKEDGCSATHNNYAKEINEWATKIRDKITFALEQYQSCERANCSCHKAVIDKDLAPFSEGITRELIEQAGSKGTKYQIFNGKLYREKECHFPARCAGIEHYLKALAPKLPDMDLIINTRDWPQVNHVWGHKKVPVFSFSKTKDHYDIMYPTWSFWEGGPAIALYPTGIGRWDKHRLSISVAAENWPWEKKEEKGFFRGSRTNEERDALILLSRSKPELVDAQYTKNQAWKSDADTLYAPPATEVSFEDHCKYKYLFNYRGVAASFRFKHLFLCKSLVFHVGDQWLEFFYPSLKPWVHYVPVNPKAKQEEIKEYIEYFKENDSLAKAIADRGFQHIWDNLTDKDVKCYWRKLLKKYVKLLKYEVKRDESLIIV
ncbi:O-glucosyltransferase rumi homolog [Pectinophora gossypiella]|uniref:O-glucosyltransferase rumi homolog n=1 Tax=Pectinophora gossypiella TaxID=13191 RepID=UPI00214EC98D|nr:O-glucosyltransferase rumi homolog [Pectinophora gossypiella]